MTAPLPPPPTTRKARATYESIIGATRAVVRTRGIVSPELIADHARVSPATFYTYFSSKDAALAAAFDAALTDMAADLDRSLSIETLLETGLESTMRNVVRSVVGGFTHDARIFRLAISRLPESDLVRQIYRHHEQAILSRLERFIRLGAAANLIRPDDAETLAAALLVSIQGYQNPLLLRQGSNVVTEALATMLAALLKPEPRV